VKHRNFVACVINPTGERHADLIAPGWADMDDEASNEVIAAAYRVHNAGYAIAASQPLTGGEKSEN
jgi:hypothetical protein